MKVAVFHDWFEKVGIEEKVLQSMLDCIDSVDLFTFSNHLPEFILELNFSKIVDLKQKINFHNPAKQIEKFYHELSKYSFADYDVIISNSIGPMRWFKEIPYIQNRKLPVQLAYTYGPYPYLYDDHQDKQHEDIHVHAIELDEEDLTHLKRKDLSFARGIDFSITNSKMMRNRLKRLYGLESEILYPPIDHSVFLPQWRTQKNHFIIESPLEYSYSFETVLKSFNYIKDSLIVIGTGTAMADYESYARKNIQFVGEMDDSSRADLINEAHALIVADTEHYQHSALETVACGIPIICHKESSAYELIAEGQTGLSYSENSEDGLLPAIFNFKEKVFLREKLQNHLKLHRHNFNNSFASYFQRVVQGLDLT